MKRKRQSSYTPPVSDYLDFYPTQAQRQLIESISKNDITFGHGYPGTGKTMSALFLGLKMLDRGEVDKIIYIRSDVEMDGSKGTGFLPGTEAEKFNPLLIPLKGNLSQLVTRTKMEYLVSPSREKIEGMLVDYARGVTFIDSFVIVDEVQNMTPHMVKTLLTRIGRGSKMVFLGDSKQRDCSRFEDGLSHAVTRLKGLEGVGIIYFTQDDIVRHPLIANILDRL